MNNNIDGIILDIDGTIWDTTGIVASAWNNAIKNMGLTEKPVTADVLKKEFGKTMDAIASDLWPTLQEPLRSTLLEACCKQEQIAIAQNTADITFPHVIQTIRTLSKNYDFFIVSNCQNGYIELTMQKNGIESCIKDFECFGNTGKGKAANLRLLTARNNLQHPLYVGDTQGDADACAACGVPFVWASYGFGTADSYWAKLDSFADLPAVLSRSEETAS